MSRRSAGRYIGWEEIALFLEMLVIIFLFSFAVITRSELYASYSRDSINQESYCESQYADKFEKEDAVCQSFWYRSVNDPAIAWGFYYSCLTGLLVIFAGGTILVGLRSISIQRSEARRLFVADQRPWIRTDFFVNIDSSSFDDLGNLHLSYDLRITNFGKTPAMNFAGSQRQFVHGSLGINIIEERFNFCREQAKRLMTIGRAIFPSEFADEPGLVVIPKDILDATWIPGNIGSLTNVVIFCFAYGDTFGEHNIYETSRCMSLSLLGPLAPLPRNAMEMRQASGRQWTAISFRTVIT